MRIAIANSAEVDALWPTLGPKFVKATERFGDDLSSGELWQMCRSGNAFLVVVFNDLGVKMGCVVRFERWTNGAILRVLSLVGEDLKDWAEQVKGYLNQMAINGGAERIVAEGREGWAKIFDEPKAIRQTYVMRVEA